MAAPGLKSTTFSFSAVNKEKYCLVHIKGKFNTSSLAEIRKSVECAVSLGQKVVAFELSEATAIDNGAVGLLMSFQRALSADGGCVKIVAPQRAIYQSLMDRNALAELRMYPSLPAMETEVVSGFTKEDRGFYALIKMPKEFSITVVKPLREAIAGSVSAGQKNFVFDLSLTTQITSVGIGILMNLHKRLLEKGGGVSLVAMTPLVRKVIESTNVLRMLAEFKTVEEAERKLL